MGRLTWRIGRNNINNLIKFGSSKLRNVAIRQTKGWNKIQLLSLLFVYFFYCIIQVYYRNMSNFALFQIMRIFIDKTT